MKIVDQLAPEPIPPREARGIPIGTVFHGTVGVSGTPSVYLRTYNNVVDLKSPNRTWELRVSVKDYEPVEAEVHVVRRL